MRAVSHSVARGTLGQDTEPTFREMWRNERRGMPPIPRGRGRAAPLRGLQARPQGAMVIAAAPFRGATLGERADDETLPGHR